MADAQEVKPVAKKPTKKLAGNKKPAGKQSEQPPNKKQKAEAKAAEPEEEEQAGVSLKGTFIKDLRPMLYGFGDDADPLEETAQVVEDIVIEYATGVLGKAMDGAVGRGKLKPGARVASLGIGAEDIMYVVRKDPKKFLRVKELLAQGEEIKKARQQLDVDDIAAGKGIAAAK